MSFQDTLDLLADEMGTIAGQWEKGANKRVRDLLEKAQRDTEQTIADIRKDAERQRLDIAARAEERLAQLEARCAAAERRVGELEARFGAAALRPVGR